MSKTKSKKTNPELCEKVNLGLNINKFKKVINEMILKYENKTRSESQSAEQLSVKDPKDDNKHNSDSDSDSDHDKQHDTEKSQNGDSKEIKKSDKKETKIRCNKSHLFLTAVNEYMLSLVFNEIQQHVKKDKNGLFIISKMVLETVFAKHSELNAVFNQYSLHYDDLLDYGSLYAIDKSTLTKYFDSKFGKTLHFVGSAFNFMMFMFVKLCTQLVMTCIFIIRSANSVTINKHVFNAALNISMMNSPQLVNACTKIVHEMDQLYHDVTEEKKAKAETQEGKEGKEGKEDKTTKSDHESDDETVAESDDDDLENKNKEKHNKHKKHEKHKTK